MTKSILYFADPMCSWCWGFHPVLQEIETAAAGRAEIVIFAGGLRPFTETPMTDKDRAAIRTHWEHVHEASGQPFDFTFFDRTEFTYDTEPACRAIVAARRIDPALAAPMLGRLHRAFYAEGRDTTDPEVLADLADEIGIPRGDFQIVHADTATKADTLAEFQYTQRSQITGFPTLIGITAGAPPVALSMGYQPWQNLQPALTKWLDGGAP